MLRFHPLYLIPFILLSACGGPAQPSPEELLKRVKAAQLQWDSYQEDIKGQIGATPVALWDGVPEIIKVNGSRIEVIFLMHSPWDTYPVVMPVLLRGPLGKVYTNSDFKVDGAKHINIFEITELAEIGNLPWVELHYPHTERRFTLIDGKWQKE